MMHSLVETLLNSLQLSMLCFLLAAGLTMIFGLMGTLNLAHGAFYAGGAYAGVVAAAWTGSYTVALLLGAGVPFAAGFLLQKHVLQPLTDRGRSTHLDLALLTFGLLFAISGALEVGFGPSFRTIPTPALLVGSVEVLGVTYPTYRVFIICSGLLAALILWWILDRTKVGAVVRAGVDDVEMVSALGINARSVFALVFGAGAAVAGAAGVISAPVLGIYPQMGMSVLVLTFVVVVIGGLGSVAGSFFGALIVGFVDTIAQTYVPAVDMFAIYTVMVVIMMFKPQGLFAITRRAT